MKILVTGATGYVGSAIIRSMVGEYEVWGLCNTGQPFEPKVNWINCNLNNFFDIDYLPKSIDIIIHLAQSYNYHLFPDKADEIFTVNVSGTLRLLEYARKADCQLFVYSSSGGVYGRGIEAFNESSPLNPLDFYASTKQMSELLIYNYRQYFSTIILRPFFIYGPRQKGKLIPNLIDSIFSRRPIVIQGEKGIIINPIYIDDVVEVIQRSIRLSGHHIFNVAGMDVVSLLELVQLLEDFLGINGIYKFDKGVNPGYLVGEITQLQRRLSYTPRVSITDGLERVIREITFQRS